MLPVVLYDLIAVVNHKQDIFLDVTNLVDEKDERVERILVVVGRKLSLLA